MASAPSISPLSDVPFRAKSRVRELCLALGFDTRLLLSLPGNLAYQSVEL